MSAAGIIAQTRECTRSLACFMLTACWAVASLVPGFVELQAGALSYSVERVDHNHLHIYRSSAASPVLGPVVVFLHGGGWTSCGLDTYFPLMFGYEFVGRALASRGIDTALISYPLVALPLHIELCTYAAVGVFALVLALVLSCVWLPLWFWVLLAVPCYIGSVLLLKQRTFAASSLPASNTGRFSDQKEKVRAMYRLVCTAFPGRRIVLVGHSAGAHHAALMTLDGRVLLEKDPAATIDCRARVPDAVVLLSGPYDIIGMHKAAVQGNFFASLCDKLLLSNIFREVDMPAASPTYLAQHCSNNVPTKHTLSWYVVTAFGDAPILEKQADEFYTALVRIGRNTSRVRGLGIGHGIGMVASEAVWAFVELVARSLPAYDPYFG